MLVKVWLPDKTYKSYHSVSTTHLYISVQFSLHGKKKILSSKRGRKKKEKKKDLGLKIRSEQHKYLIWQEGQTFSTYIHNSLSHKKHITYDESDKTNRLPLELSKSVCCPVVMWEDIYRCLFLSSVQYFSS